MTPKLIGYRLKKDLLGWRAGGIFSIEMLNNQFILGERIAISQPDWFEPIYEIPLSLNEEEKSDEEILKFQIEKWLLESCRRLTLKEEAPLEFVAHKLLSTFNLDVSKLRKDQTS
jgi:hypothetical protein